MFFCFSSCLLLILPSRAGAQMQVFLGHRGPTGIPFCGQCTTCEQAGFPELCTAPQLSPDRLPAPLQSPSAPMGAELWHEWPPHPELLLGKQPQLGAPETQHLPAELAALLEVNPPWRAAASPGWDALPAPQKDPCLLHCKPGPQPGLALEPEDLLQGVVIAVMGKHRLNHSGSASHGDSAAFLHLAANQHWLF